jgi:GNAT superfamily N-acetyltransferase
MGGMIGTRTHGHASLKLAVPTALPDDLRGPVVELRSLHTRKDKRGQGEATALMADVCNEADKARRFLFLHVKPDGPMGTEALANFYIRNGFHPIQAEPLLMLRPFRGAYGG